MGFEVSLQRSQAAWVAVLGHEVVVQGRQVQRLALVAMGQPVLDGAGERRGTVHLVRLLR